jgi:serine/threonine protein kinase
VRYEAPAFPRDGIEYLSPEYLNRYQLDFRNDVYQLGLLIFELLTGQLPWRYRSIARLLQEKSQGVIHLHKIDSTVPVQFSMLVSKMMEPSPKKRFSSIKHVEESIEQSISSNFGAIL